MRTNTLVLLLIACSPLQRSEAKQSADSACVDAALAAYVARPDPFIARVGDFCIERSRHNTARELELRTQPAVAGRPSWFHQDGFDWLPIHHAAGSVGIVGVAGAAGVTIQTWERWDDG